MGMRECIREAPTDFRRVGDFDKPSINPVLCFEDVEMPSREISYQRCSRLMATIGVEYFYYPGEERAAYERALNTLIRRLYKDQHDWLHEIRHAIHESDKETALKMCNKLKESMS